MSLVNVGVQLAQSGKKVLLADFDLEAPGLPTFSVVKPKTETPGIVDFVSQYLETGESPDARNYIYESQQFPSGGGLWVMPVGHQDPQYSRRLNSINWQTLYSEQEGYLFFEDLRRQWEKSLGFDYVLIDSRTGHSDVEGICTRQLPNAVVLLFFPNDQNLVGLKRIVANIRTDNQRTDRRQIVLHFAVSNVPDLDDEDRILGRTMERFKTELGYKELAAEIHHYNSLSLLNQEIFSLARPNSRLAKEYTDLTKEITKHNLEDRDAVLQLLKLACRDIRGVVADNNPEDLRTKIDTILANFPQDGEIQYRVALLHEQMGNVEDALNLLLGNAVEGSFATAATFAVRARLNHLLGRKDDAKRDLEMMLSSEGAELDSFLEATSLMDVLDPSQYTRLPTSKALLSLSPNNQMFVAFQCNGGSLQLQAKLSILQRLKDDGRAKDTELDGALVHELALVSIASRKFDDAVDILQPTNTQKEPQISALFNLAMAFWGRDKLPPIPFFEQVAKMDETVRLNLDVGPNYLECLAIAHAVLKNSDRAIFFLKEARSRMLARPRREFSAWSYTKVGPKEFLQHLDEIEALIQGKDVMPRFLME